ncbi:hypothetical protein [Schaalia suimastitidis]|uniref:hypothetical protein n=1 Tax=Schaalia suimastitidis TaxID=121163 RepID=UPI0004042AA0|nr:hypothetical protein [Schaalia suimastitidis]
MTIDALVNPPLSVLYEAADDPAVQARLLQVREAMTRLRFHEGLRRTWEAARAEAAIREAVALSLLEGVRTSVDDLRAWTLSDTNLDRKNTDPGLALALGIWRSQWNLASSFPALNSRHGHTPLAHPLPRVIAGCHRDIASVMLAGGWVEADMVAIPRDTMHLSYAQELIASSLPAPLLCAALIAHFRFREVFTPASGAVGSAVARWLLVTRGVDPTGVAVISALDGTDAARASQMMAGWVRADTAGVARWYLHALDAMIHGARIGADVARHVQAGRLH